MVVALAGGGMVIEYDMEHRSGICRDCGTPFERFDTGKVDDEGNPIEELKCPQCVVEKAS